MIMPGILQTNFSVSSRPVDGWGAIAHKLQFMSGEMLGWMDWPGVNLRGGNWRQNSLFAKYNDCQIANKSAWMHHVWVRERYQKVQIIFSKWIMFQWSLARSAVVLVAILVVDTFMLQAITLEILHAFLNLSHEECQIFKISTGLGLTELELP